MNTLIVSAQRTNGFMFLPARDIEDGVTLKSLARFGLVVLGEENDNGFCKCQLPEGWSTIESLDSPMQVRLIDDRLRLRAKIYYRVGSEGGGASMEVMPRFSILVKTADRRQWAEINDGWSVMTETKKSLWSDRMSDKLAAIRDHEQPEYKVAEAILSAFAPDYKKPLAYWD
jgi:hypothetical protein